MLCWKPSVWPTSCATTYCISWPMRSSGSGSVFARGSSGPTCDEVPVARQVHDVVVELDVRLENLAGARIVDVRARRVLDRRRQPADHRVARVFRRSSRDPPSATALPSRGCVLEPGRFERGLPVLDALLDVRHPLRRRGRIDAVDDRLHRLGERRVRILLLEAVAGDVAALAARDARPGRSRSCRSRSSRRARRRGAASSASRAAAPCCSA